MTTRKHKPWLILSPVFSRRGGIERYLADLTENLLKQKFTFSIGCIVNEIEALQHTPQTHIPAPRSPLFLRTLLFNLVAFFKISPRKYFIHAHGAACLNADIITAHSCHKAWFLESLAATPKFTMAWCKKILNPVHYVSVAVETWQYNHSRVKKVICVSNIVRDHLRKYFKIDPKKLVVLHSGVNTDEFCPAALVQKLALRAQLQLPKDRQIFIFVANEFRRKRLSTVLQALARMPNDPLLLVVGGDDPASFKIQARDLGISENSIRFLGLRRDLASLYQASDIFVLPTCHDAFALVVLEAMATGLPAITTSAAGVSEIIDHQRDGLILTDPDDADTLWQLMQYASTHAQELAVHARRKAEAYSWPVVTARMIQQYQDLSQQAD